MKKIQWRRWFKRLGIFSAVMLVLGVAAVLYISHRMKLADENHQRFFNTGKSINDFLKDYAHALEESYESGEPAPVLALYSEDYTSPERGQWSLGSPADLGDASMATLARLDETSFDREQLGDEFKGYFADITSVDRVKCKINLIEEAEPEQSAVLTVKYILDGKNEAQQLFQDRFFFRWHLEKQPDADGIEQWRITRDELVEGCRVAGNGRGFVKADAASIGIDYVHQRDPNLDPKQTPMKFAVIQHAMGGVSAVDYDNDSRADLFFADGVRCRLYKNVGSGTPGVDADPSGALSPAHFRDVTEEAGLGAIDRANCGLFADVDNDGDKDLFVGRYLSSCRMLLNNGDGTFKEATEQFGLGIEVPCVAGCFLDYNLDGYPDLYLGVNGNAHEQSPNIPFYATNGMPNRLFRNEGGKRFVDVTDESNTGNTGWTLAVAAGDYDGDGDPDIGIANDFGRKYLFSNNGDGTFTDVAKEAGVLDFSGGMGIVFGDLNFDGRADLYTSNINSNQRWFGEETTISQYTRNVIRTKWIWKDLDEFREVHRLLGDQWRELGKMTGEGNSLFYNNGDGTFRELKDSHTNRAGWGWSVALMDADNDTDLDIYAANGWISGENKDDL